jgi:hypothetical protein
METDTASIRWVNDCEYILKNYTQKHGRRKSIDMKIWLTTSGNTYTFEFGMVGSTSKQRNCKTSRLNTPKPNNHQFIIKQNGSIFKSWCLDRTINIDLPRNCPRNRQHHFISIAGKLPVESRKKATKIGCFYVHEIALYLVSIYWFKWKHNGSFKLVSAGITGQSIILLLGGLFLIYKALVKSERK